MKETLYPKGSAGSAAPRTRVTPPAPPKAGRCLFHSRAYGGRCEKPAGHHLERDATKGHLVSPWCESLGDCFAPGYIPGKGETL